MRNRYLAFAVLLLSACATTDIVELSPNSIRLEIVAAQGCGPDNAASFAERSAAVETLRRGFDSFTMTSIDQRMKERKAYMPIVGGSMVTVIPITHQDHAVTADLTMYRNGERDSHKATDARAVLGPDWAGIVERGVHTCN